MSTLSDAELNRLVAEKVCGWIHLHASHHSQSGWTAEIDSWVDEHGRHMEIPPFATSVDAVLPLLESQRSVDLASCYVDGNWHVTLTTRDNPIYVSKAPTFAKAAVLALLKAAGVEV